MYADNYPEIQIDLLTSIVDRCSKHVRNYILNKRRRSRNQKGRNLPDKRCQNGAGLFASCFNREIYRNCPPQIERDSKLLISMPMKFKQIH